MWKSLAEMEREKKRDTERDWCCLGDTLPLDREQEKLHEVSLAGGLEPDSFPGVWINSSLSVVRVQVFLPVGEADVFSNNEKEHMAKTHLRGGQSPESLLISIAVCNRRKKLVERLKDIYIQCCYQYLGCTRLTTLPHFSTVIKVWQVNRYQIVLVLVVQIDVFIPIICCLIISYFA